MKKRWMSVPLVIVLGLSGCGSAEPEEAAEENEEMASLDFETTPVLYPQGYLVKSNGAYGIVNLDQEYSVNPIYKYVLYFEDDLILMENEEDTEGFNVSEGMFQTSGYSYDDGGYVTVFDGDVLSQKYYLDNETEDMELADFFDAYVLTNVVYDRNDVTSPDFYKTAPYYIRIGNSGTLYGPYDVSDSASFAIEVLQGRKENHSYAGSKLNPQIKYLFYEKTDNGYVIHNFDDSKVSEKTFDSVEWLSESSAKVTSGNEMGIIDQDCNLVIWGEYEDVAQPSDGMTFVKVDGKWSVVSV